MKPLPQKQNGIFKKILKCYDSKQYKMGLKLAKQILSNPDTANHGETLAMKGLILNCLGKKEEAFDNVRKGLRNDLTSHVCWHVYGLLQRSEHKYDEAIKCYRNALKYDKQNITILRDLSLLQIQMRDLEGFRDTRYQLFILRPAQRVSWISFAVAYHLLQDYETALRILQEFRQTQSQSKNNSHYYNNKANSPIEYEQSELLLYQVMIYQEAKQFKEAHDFLTKHTSEISDRLAVLELKVKLLLALGRKSAAVTILTEQLLVRNQENIYYYELLEQAMNVAQNDETARLQIYENVQQKYTSARVPQLVPLKFIQDPKKFKELSDVFLRKMIRKCQPGLFRNMKQVYSSDDKVDGTSSNKMKIVEDLMLSYEKNLMATASFESDPSTQNSENKTHILFVYYYLAQHYDYLGQHDKALSYVETALNHTPTFIELLTLKAKISKHKGESDVAAELMTEAQRLDTADRYLNSKCAKYLLRANKIEQADEMCAKFTRQGISVAENLNEMQCMWFHVEAARAHYRLREYGKALAKCLEIDAYFSEVNEDQFDFHSYCMRTMTLRSYIRLLRMEDTLKSHHFYFEAAELAIVIYLQLYDKPLVKNTNDKQQTKGGGAKGGKDISSKTKDKQDKQHSNKDKESNKENKQQEKKDNINQSSPDELEHPVDPLKEAVKFLTPLKTLAVNKIETHFLAFEVYKRKNKILLMLQSIKRALKVDPSSKRLEGQLSEFRQIVDKALQQSGDNSSSSPSSLLENLSGPVAEVLKLELVSLPI